MNQCMIRRKKMQNLTTKEKDLIKKFESGKKPNKKNTFDSKKEMYLKQTDRNYKDGDRN